MNQLLGIYLFAISIVFQTLYADTIYITGGNNDSRPCYWTIVPPASPSTFQELDETGFTDGTARGVAFANSQTVYIVGNVVDDEESSASYWTVTGAGPASPLNTLPGSSDSAQVSINGIAYNPSGVGYMVGVNDAGNSSFWTVSPTGVVSSATEIGTEGFAQAIAFGSDGTGYIAGADSSYGAAYWTISPTGTASGSISLVGGEAGGVGTAYAVAVTPSGTAYIVGITTSGFACYWTVSPEGVASSANILDGGSNSNARGVAFLPDGSGIIVGQGTGNVSCYWPISSTGIAGALTPLPNGEGSSSSAYAVAYASDGTAYIVGSDSSFQSVYWTLALSATVADYHLLDSGGYGIATAIAIYFPQGPNPPQNLTGKYVKNSFGWTYEYCAVLRWTKSDSSDVVAYHIYRNGLLIATVDSSKSKYEDHNQSKTLAEYSVAAVDASGKESTLTTVTIK